MGYSDLIIEIEVEQEVFEGVRDSGSETTATLYNAKTLQRIADEWGDGWKVEIFPEIIVNRNYDITVYNLPMLVHDDAKCGFNVYFWNTGGYNPTYHADMLMYNYETKERKQINIGNRQADLTKTAQIVNASYYTKYISLASDWKCLFTRMIDRYDNRTLKWYTHINNNLLDFYRLAILDTPLYPPETTNTSMIEGATPYVVLVPLVMVTETEEAESPNIFRALYDTEYSSDVKTKVIDGKEYLNLQVIAGYNTYIRIGDKE